MKRACENLGERNACVLVLISHHDRNQLEIAKHYLKKRQLNFESMLCASDGAAGDQFGYSCSISGTTAVITATKDDDRGADSGSAYVFVRNGTSWSQEAYLKASNTDGDDEFGHVVAMSGDTVVVGARGEDSASTGVNGDQGSGAANSGAVYVFSRGISSWGQDLYVKASNTGQGDRFGDSVAIDGVRIVVGASMEDSGANTVNGNQSDNSASAAGAAFVFLTDAASNYCLAVSNSTGSPASISAGGSTSIAANTFLLRAQPVPVQPGLFFYGPQQTQVPFGNGFRCIAGMLFRLDVENASATGVLEHLVDFTDPPSLAGQIASGSTWNFQAWYRDPTVGPSFFNLSDGLSVTFGP